MQEIYKKNSCQSVISIKLLWNFIEITLRRGYLNFSLVVWEILVWDEFFIHSASGSKWWLNFWKQDWLCWLVYLWYLTFFFWSLLTIILCIRSKISKGHVKSWTWISWISNPRLRTLWVCNISAPFKLFWYYI